MFRGLVRQLRRLPTHLREDGIAHTLELACAYGSVPGWLYYRHRTHLLQLGSIGRVLAFRTRPEYRYLPASDIHLDELANLDVHENAEFMARLFSGFFKTGASCYVIQRGRRIVAYNWLFDTHYTLTSDGYGARQLGLRLQPGATMFGNGYIAPEYRMKGLFPLLIRMAVQDRPEDTSFFTTIERLNLNSLRAHHRIGFKTLGTITCQRFLASPYCWSWHAAQGSTRVLGCGQPELALSEILRPEPMEAAVPLDTS